eukprot:6130650-Amphidinium_carterae.1
MEGQQMAVRALGKNGLLVEAQDQQGCRYDIFEHSVKGALNFRCTQRFAQNRASKTTLLGEGSGFYHAVQQKVIASVRLSAQSPTQVLLSSSKDPFMHCILCIYVFDYCFVLVILRTFRQQSPSTAKNGTNTNNRRSMTSSSKGSPQNAEATHLCISRLAM